MTRPCEVSMPVGAVSSSELTPLLESRTIAVGNSRPKGKGPSASLLPSASVMIVASEGSYVCHRVAVDPHCAERSVQNAPQY